MKHIFWTIAAIGMLLVTGCAKQRSAATSPGQVAKPVTLKVSSAYPLNLPIIGEGLQYLGERLAAASDQTVKLKLYEPNALVHPKELLDAVSTGKIDAGYGAAGFWQGKLPAAPLFSSVPFGPETGEYVAWMFHGNGMKLYQRMYDDAGYNVKVLICTILPPETSGWFGRPINRVEDLQGLKMRFFGLGGDVMSKLGVGVEMLAGAEIYPALEKGRLDATEFSMPVIDERLGFHRIVKYNYYPGWHQQATFLEILINKDSWSALSPGQQALFELACRDAMVQSIANGEGAQFQVMKNQVDGHGVKRMRWSPEMLALFEKTWHEVAAEHSAQNAFFAEVWQDLQAFRKGYDVWEANAFLPRAAE